MAISERELRCLDNTRLFESLISFAEMIEELPDEIVLIPRRRSCKVKYDYDYRVVVANIRNERYA